MSTDFSMVGCRRIASKHVCALAKIPWARLLCVYDLLACKGKVGGEELGVARHR